MGLAQQKRKDRTKGQLDPRNTAWSRDEGKYGHQMLLKMGWTPQKGLGKGEDGCRTHLALQRREGNVGVGGERRREDEWSSAGGDAYERILKALNEKMAAKGRGQETGTAEAAEAATQTATSKGSRVPTDASEKPTGAPHRLAHRAKYLAAKRAMVTGSGNAMNEILGLRTTTTPVSADEPGDVQARPDDSRPKKKKKDTARVKGNVAVATPSPSDPLPAVPAHLAQLPIPQAMPKAQHRKFARESKSPSPSPDPGPVPAAPVNDPSLGASQLTKSQETVWEYFARRQRERKEGIKGAKGALGDVDSLAQDSPVMRKAEKAGSAKRRRTMDEQAAALESTSDRGQDDSILAELSAVPRDKKTKKKKKTQEEKAAKLLRKARRKAAKDST